MASSTSKGRSGRKAKAASPRKGATKKRASTKARPKAKASAAPAKRAGGARTKAPKKAAPHVKAAAVRSAPARRPAAPRRDPVRELARRIVDVTVANDDEAAFALYGVDIESAEPGQPPMRGIGAIRQKYAGWRQMTSATRFEPRRMCVDGNTIMIEWVGTVTLAGSGKTVELRELAIHEVENGKIARETYYYDPSVLASQAPAGDPPVV